MKKVCIVVATLFTAEAFLLDQIAQLSREYAVSVAASGGNGNLFGDVRVIHIEVPIQRKISLLADLRALLMLFSAFRRNRFDAVHSLTPKAGLLAAIAAFAAFVPVRIHTYTGQVWATRKGAARAVLKMLDRLIARLDTHVLVDSASQRDFLRQEGVLGPNQGVVLGKGSVSGVDPERFRPDVGARERVRAELGIPAAATVYLFVGRLTRDKGVLELGRAFGEVAAAKDDVFLVFVGPDEERMSDSIRAACGPHSDRVHFAGYSPQPERYMAASDVFCLPSYREGFGSVVIEAAAAGVPSIGTRIYGVVDAIEEGSTGLLVEPGDVAGLAAAMRKLSDDAPFRRALAEAARARALADFQKKTVSAALVDFYRRTLAP